MANKKDLLNRRTFLKAALGSAFTAALLPQFLSARNPKFQVDSLQVWSCGGLSEAFTQVNAIYEERNPGLHLDYTGAYAGALGKRILSGSVTEVFGGRGLALTKEIKKAGLMHYFKPLCFTEYVMVTPLGNPAGITRVEDMARPGVRCILPTEASPPGSAAMMGILKKANIQKSVFDNMVGYESCVIRMMPSIIKGEGDVSIVERRLTTMDRFKGKVEIVPIDEKYFPPGPLTFCLSVLKYARDRSLADDYVNFVRSDEAQSIFEQCGFIPSISAKGQQMIEKLGVKDE